MSAYYNENDPKAAAWLSELMRRGAIAKGDIDERSITEVQASDLRDYRQVHLFAGIGGWSIAARFAGIPDASSLWTGSCPCQPFSAAGRRAGNSDDRHLWPHMQRLIAECHPAVVFGEQVASPDGRHWLATVRTEMEALGYAIGAADLCAAGVGAPHRRQRIYFVGLADTDSGRPPQRSEATETARHGDTAVTNSSRHRPCPDRGGWHDTDWLLCRDGKWRPVESGAFPLADGVPARVGRLRGYGNAIVPQVAATFMKAALGDVV
jgi:DNA (cytosine-5)-methyltransferase 1